MNSLFSDCRPGTYALIMAAAHPGEIQVGALGTLQVCSGWYIYVGSAFGPGGLGARIGRHLKGQGEPVTASAAPLAQAKKLHWHIDYLLQVVELRKLWYTTDPARREHAWAGILAGKPGAVLPMQGFGSSDCHCISHLIYLETGAGLIQARFDLSSMYFDFYELIPGREKSDCSNDCEAGS
jgi:Uri superfamily endonuclease